MGCSSLVSFSTSFVNYSRGKWNMGINGSLTYAQATFAHPLLYYPIYHPVCVRVFICVSVCLCVCVSMCVYSTNFRGARAEI